MDAAERDIYYYLRSRRPKSATFRDISRHVGGKRKFRYNPDWATPVLLRMVERGIVETDAQGCYRVKPLPRKDTQGKQWASDAIAELLKASGKTFRNLITVEDEDAYYDKL